jgi:hypothetical protein
MFLRDAYNHFYHHFTMTSDEWQAKTLFSAK